MRFPTWIEVRVDNDQSVKMAVFRGGYYRVDWDINSCNFPSDRSGARTVAVNLLHFGRSMTSGEIMEYCEAHRLRLADLPEILAIGSSFPQFQLRCPIAGLGATWATPYGYGLCVILDSDGERRLLDLRRLDREWGERCRFAAVRE